jgi:hypothetical protein
MSKYLSKGRFIQAVSCPTKLAYSGNPEYVDKSNEDDFLKMLAEGGFQVGELAKVMYPDGVEVTDTQLEDQAKRTQTLLNQAQCTVFEGTFIHENWLVRVDIVRKSGDVLELIEVKAKSFDSTDGDAESVWRTKTAGSIKPAYLKYLQDVAFQVMVVRAAYPSLTVRPFLMLPDKSAASTVAGLNQMFRIHRSQNPDGSTRSRAEPVAGVTVESVGLPLLKRIDVSSFVEQIFTDPLEIPGGTGDFRSLASEWAAVMAAERRIDPVIGPQCRKCQFRSDSPPPGKRSGFHECWRAPLQTSSQSTLVHRPVVDIYYPVARQIEKLMQSGRRTFADLQEEDLPSKVSESGLSRAQRQRMQVFGTSERYYFDSRLWRVTESNFSWPLNFIDFEGARTALPLQRGGKPYEQVAFQFSHHVMERDGSVRHANEFITLESGKDPNLLFVRALRTALSDPSVQNGTVFMWHHYERDVLVSLTRQLTAQREADSAPEDVDELLEFLHARGAKEGPFAMVDMLVLAEKLFFHPNTQGSSSIKVVLPAVLDASLWLRDRYSKPIYGAAGGIPSLNFPLDGEEGMVWWRQTDKHVMNPYELLPPVFSDLAVGWEDEINSDDASEIADGGAAMTAYLRMQFSDVAAAERAATRKALLRYCELDTLAMVMVYEAWREWARSPSPS